MSPSAPSEPGSGLRIFIAYRRDDSQGFARSIHDRLASGNVIQTIDVGAGPEGITAGPDSIWFANGEDDTVTRIKP